MDDRRKLLEQLSKQHSKTGKISTQGLVNPKYSPVNQALQARDLTQQVLAHEVLKNTGIPIPSAGARPSTLEDFYNRIMQERYPELIPDVDVADLSKDGDKGAYYPSKNKPWIEMNKSLWKANPEDAIGTLLHESGHQYDHQIMGREKGNPINEKFRFPGMDPNDAYEIVGQGHHLENIEGKRGSGTFGKAAIDNLKKTGTFRALPAIGAVSQIVPAIVDIKEGSPNTAAARMITSLAPAGTEAVSDDLIVDAQIRDKSPELLDPTYQRTLKNIGERRSKEGRSPVVESFSGQKVDTSATSDSDIMNQIIQHRMNSRQG